MGWILINALRIWRKRWVWQWIWLVGRMGGAPLVYPIPKSMPTFAQLTLWATSTTNGSFALHLSTIHTFPACTQIASAHLCSPSSLYSCRIPSAPPFNHPSQYKDSLLYHLLVHSAHSVGLWCGRCALYKLCLEVKQWISVCVAITESTKRQLTQLG